MLAGDRRNVGSAAIPANRGGCGKGVDMLWNVGTIVRQEMQGAAVPIEGAPSVVKSRELAMGSPAFDAWLQAYRKRLEEACQRAHSRPASPANAKPAS